MVTPKGKCEQWQCHATRDQVPQPNAALDGLPDRSVWERLKSAKSSGSLSRDQYRVESDCGRLGFHDSMKGGSTSRH